MLSLLPRPWLAGVLAALVASLALAAVTWADGEDDPSFGTVGTAFPFTFGDDDGVFPIGTPHASVGPDGTVLHAGAVFPQRTDLRGDGPSPGIRVSRVLPGGAPDPSFGTGGTELVGVDGVPELLDARILPDGTIVLAVAAYFGLNPDDRAARGGNGAEEVILFHLDRQGGVIADPLFFSPADCNWARAAEIASDGTAYVLWADCVADRRGPGFGYEVVSRIGAGDADWDRPVANDDFTEVQGIDLAIGPNGDVHLAAAVYELSRDVNSSVDSIVLRYSPAGALDASYGGPAQRLDGGPVDIDVDGSGRAVVWVSDIQFGRDADGPWHFRRLQPSGAVDTTFGGDGLAALDAPTLTQPGVPLDGCPFVPLLDVCHPWQLRAQPDGKVIATGPAEVLDERGGFGSGTQWNVARLGADGERDPSWAGNGLRTLTFEGVAEGEAAVLFAVGQAALQADRKVVLPLVAVGGVPVKGRIAAPAGLVHGLQRLNATPEPTQQQQQSTQPPVTGAAPSRQASRVCKSRRTFTIRLRTGRRKAERSPIVSATVRVNGKKVKVTRQARRSARVNLKNLPRGRFTVSIRLRLKDGGIVSETRRYRTCAKKVERELKPLRTRPPR